MSEGYTLDLAFAMDCTGSMASYIQSATQNIKTIVDSITTGSSTRVRLALIEYRDHPPQEETFVTRTHDFTHSVISMKSWLDNCSAIGGGDTPEAVADALYDVSNLSWSSDVKMCVLISDAPPHGLVGHGDGFHNGCPIGHDPINLSNKLAEMGITVNVVGCEPYISEYKDFFMAIAVITGGVYVPLGNAVHLSQAITGMAKEELCLQGLMKEVNTAVLQFYKLNGGVNEEIVTKDLFQTFSHRCVQVQKLERTSGSLPKPSGRAKRFARFPNLAEVRKKYSTTKSSRRGSEGSGGSIQVVNNTLDITQVQRMVQKSIMMNKIKLD